jgi:hypothetical protein
LENLLWRYAIGRNPDEILAGLQSSILDVPCTKERQETVTRFSGGVIACIRYSAYDVGDVRSQGCAKPGLDHWSISVSK